MCRKVEWYLLSYIEMRVDRLREAKVEYVWHACDITRRC